MGCWPAEEVRDWVWIQALGSTTVSVVKEIFKKINDLSGGFIKTQEETSLKNHLHWARIKVKGDGGKVLREIEVTDGGFVYTIPIWCEIPVTVKKVAMEKENLCR